MWGKIARYLDEDDLRILSVIGLVVALGVLLTVLHFRKTTPVRSLPAEHSRAKLIERYAAEHGGPKPEDGRVRSRPSDSAPESR